ncbi:AAA domain containing protein, putative [Hepatocystis sp. ex Piliocolobus tephrosceles]|nr:AAA domain containing protein, putative [Hepatocystis sp. ex Piliocolobus tephrosceles]
MTTLEKIGIQGVRSYCDERTETLEFYSPVTIIYGKNGSGKSTIIECLKVSCIGEFPTNAEKGKSFIHDPLVSNKMNVKGKIDLMFRNYNNKRIGVSRSYNLCYNKDKNKNIKHNFRSLDNSIIIKKDTGKDIIITNKCIDINTHIPLLMGISKALLENVILCNHDENLWLFSESTKVKKKFDEIFGDDNFSKIIEGLNKCRKSINEIIKKKELELLNLKNNYEKKKNMVTEIESNKKQIEIEKKQIQLEQEDIYKKSNKLKKLNEKKNIINTLLNEINTNSILYNQFQSDKQQYNNIKTIYTENLTELNEIATICKQDLLNCDNLINKINKEIENSTKSNEMFKQNCPSEQPSQKECEYISNTIQMLKKKKKNISNCFFLLSAMVLLFICNRRGGTKF